MCTTAAINLNGFFLIKTRDPVRGKIFEDDVKLFEDRLKKLIICNDDGMYGGINEKGVGIVATYVKVEERQIPYFDDDYVRKILDTDTSSRAMEIVKGFDPPIGGNMFIADRDQCFSLECGPDQTYIEEVMDRKVLTNHFHKLPYQPMNYSDPFIRNWTCTRYERASLLLEKIKEWEDLKSILSDHKDSPELSICNHGIIPTASAFIIDTKKRKLHYCKGNPCRNPFNEYST